MSRRGLWGALAALVAALAIVVALVVPTAYLPGIQADWEQRAADMGITVIFTDDERNCGAQIGGGFGGGCFFSETPDVIYLGFWLSSDQLRNTALHELAHVQQYRLGLPGDECAADAQAIAWGASHGHYTCK